MKAALFIALLALAARAHERDVDFDPHPGASVSPSLGFREARMNTYYGGAPLVLVLGYQGCVNLCSTTLDGVSLALQVAGLQPERDYRALFVSIDARDESVPPARHAGWHFLTGAASAAALAKAVGFRYYYDAASGEFAHPAGFVVLTPQGQVARYFEGVRYNAAEVRAAIAGAQRGETQGVFERLLLRCFHDPVVGRNTTAVMTALRLAMATLVIGLGVLAWRNLR